MKKNITIVLSVFLVFSAQNVFASDETESLILDELVTTYLKDLDLEIIQQALQEASEGQLTALTGTTTLGNFLNDQAAQEAREWSPSEWASAVSGGNNSRYKQLLEDYQKAHPSLSTSNASLGMSSENATDYQQQVDTNQAASTHATYAFNEANQHLENIDDLSKQSNEASDTKHIQDLNARMNAEIAYLQVEVIKGIAVMNQQMAQQQATEIHDKTEAAKFNQIPD